MSELSNPFSTGGGGQHFEAHVQACFATIMLSKGGFTPHLVQGPIVKIKLQGKVDGYDTDDIIIFIKNPVGDDLRRMLCQVKHTIKITENDLVFGEVIQSAWNDFQNSKNFTHDKDLILLVTGPLSAADSKDIAKILDWAKTSENTADFFNKLEQTNFSSESMRKKVNAFASQLKKANNNVEVPSETVFQFLRHFHILVYDTWIESLTITLLQCILGETQSKNVHETWSRILEEVQFTNRNAGTITPEGMFEQLQIVHNTDKRMPQDLLDDRASAQVDWSEQSILLATANLLGSWDQGSEADRRVIEQMTGTSFSTWILGYKPIILHSQTAPLLMKNGVWAIKNREKLWDSCGSGIFDDNLDAFKKCVVAVLKEQDPQFELPSEQRYAAAIHGKILRHSKSLRSGIAETLVLIDSHSAALTNCSLRKKQDFSPAVIYEIFDGADFVLWGSLNDILPLLAEAAPDTFLSAVEATLKKTPSPFAELFSQEGNGVTGRNYLTGLLWALEGLAWDERYLSRVTLVLGDLATRDPGGNWANRPINSLITIFLPWLPQTTAPIPKRELALKTLQTEFPGIAWQVMVALLPQQHQVSSGSHKPIFRNRIPEDYRTKITQAEYQQQLNRYEAILVDMALIDFSQLSEIVQHLGHLSPAAFKKILQKLSSESISTKSEVEILPIWTSLVKLVTRHKRFSDAKWAFSAEMVSEIERVARLLEPKRPENLYHRLFCEYEIELYPEKNNWQEQAKKLESQRQRAIQEILDVEGLDGVVDFANKVKFPNNVGFSFGCIAKPDIDSILFPKFLSNVKGNLERFIAGYIRARHVNKSWEWVDATINVSSWTKAQIAQFLFYLPFQSGTWERVRLLGSDEQEYWKSVPVQPYQAESNCSLAIDKLLEYKRPAMAILCLTRTLHVEKTLDIKRATQSLIELLTVDKDNAIDAHDIVDIIGALQKSPDVDVNELSRIEWGYLPLLSEHSGLYPQTLGARLSESPRFFCELISSAFKSTKNVEVPKFTSQQEKIAINAYQLLSRWRVPPGKHPDGSFSDKEFLAWIEEAKRICNESGHIDVALLRIGEVLIYSPEDESGLWIRKAIAQVLDAPDADKMREGFCLELYNSRGVHWLDPSGKPELDLAAGYQSKADAAENAGYPRFAASLKKLAESYRREASRVIDEHQLRR